jgi:hypothetical protein
MIHPNEPTARGTSAVRDGQLGPVTCATCGCRLDDDGDGIYVHFGRLGGRDARGCRVDCVELSHDVSGRALIALAV